MLHQSILKEKKSLGYNLCRSIPFASSLLGLLITLNPQLAQGATVITYQSGINDNFNPSNTEVSSPRAALTTYTQTTNYPGNNTTQAITFDSTAVNYSFTHSFSLLPSDIASAILEIRVKPNGEQSCNDAIFLNFINNSGSPSTGGLTSYFGSGNGSCAFGPGYQGRPQGLYGGVWETSNSTVNNGYTFTLDLANLPSGFNNVGDIIPYLNQYGVLDISVQDDTSVDYIRLTVATPEPLTILGAATAAGFGAYFKRKQRK